MSDEKVSSEVVYRPKKTELLPVMEQFATLQGEGYHSGRAAYFIRLGGCDIGCVWCDVKESWTDDHPKQSIDDLLTNIYASKIKFAVITGGEPCMYDLNEMCKRFRKYNIEMAIETSGAYPITGKWHWICLSPKKFKAPLTESLEKANELKVIIFNKSDFKWAEEHAAKVSSDCLLYLQPEWDKKEEMLPLIIDYIKENPKWRLSNQTHKYIDIP